jgi:hypothetical protein
MHKAHAGQVARLERGLIQKSCIQRTKAHGFLTVETISASRQIPTARDHLKAAIAPWLLTLDTAEIAAIANFSGAGEHAAPPRRSDFSSTNWLLK